MNDPERLTSMDGDDPGATLLRCARRYRVSDRTRRRALATAGLAAGAGVLLTGGMVAKGAVAGTKILVLTTAGLFGVAGLVGGYLAFAPGKGHPAKFVSPTEVVAPRAVRADNPAAAGTENEVSSPPGVSASPAIPGPVAAPHPRLGVSPGRSHPSTPAGLAAELSALDAAAKVLARGEAEHAMALLEAYGREFPRGSLALEAAVLRTEALEQAGRHAEAALQARAFVKNHPRSPLAERMRAIAENK